MLLLLLEMMTKDHQDEMKNKEIKVRKGGVQKFFFNPFTADVAIMRHLRSAPLSHLCDRRGYTKVTGLSDLNTLSRRVVNGRTCLETIAA
jgi:hypothetical protein